MRVDLRQITQPEDAPVTVADMCDHLRVTDDAESSLIREYIAAATQYTETVTGRVVMRSRWVEVHDCFPPWAAPINLGLHPVSEVVEIRYTDRNGDTQTVDDYKLRQGTVPASIVIPHGYPAWPTDATEVEIEVWAGGECAPPAIKQAIRLIAAHWYENREEVVAGVVATEVPMAAKSLLRSMSVRGVA